MGPTDGIHRLLPAAPDAPSPGRRNSPRWDGGAGRPATRPLPFPVLAGWWPLHVAVGRSGSFRPFITARAAANFAHRLPPRAASRRRPRITPTELLDLCFLRLGLAPLALGRETKLGQFLRIQLAEIARFDVQHQRSVSHPPNLLDEMADLFEHLSQFAVAAFGEHHLVPGVIALADHADGCRGCVHAALAGLGAIDGDAPAQLVQLFLGGLAAHLYEIGLLHPRRGLGQLVGQVAVVGHQQQSFAQVIEPPHRVEPLRHLLEELHHRGPALGVAHGGHISPAACSARNSAAARRPAAACHRPGCDRGRHRPSSQAR